MSQLSKPSIWQYSFTAYFIAQLVSGFNDNVMLILVATSLVALGQAHSAFYASALFALPFFLFSATAGRMADRFSKLRSMLWIKLAEWLIHSMVLLAVISHNVNFMLVGIFLSGLNSALFGPLKYAVLPHFVHHDDLGKVNGWVTGSTFLAMLAGTILGSLMSATHSSLIIFAMLVFILSALSALVLIKATPDVAINPQLKINCFFLKDIASTFKLCWQQHNHSLHVVVYIAFFWAIGGSMINLVTVINHSIWQGDAVTRTVLMFIFSISLGVGCFASAYILPKKFSAKIQVSMLFIAIAGLMLIYWGLRAYQVPSQLTAINIMSNPYWLLSLLGFFIAAFGSGIYVIPLYTFIQQQNSEAILGQIMACNNLVYALIATGLSLGISALLKSYFSPLAVISLYALLCALVALSILRAFR